MPNWCANSIVIAGDEDKIKEILIKIGTISGHDKHVLFETLIGKDPDIDKVGWYESNRERFGTKWDVAPDESNIEFDDGQITFSPDTAWSPPVPFCITLAKEYGVRVEITYFEPGGDFAGKCVINESGDIEEELDYGYDEGMYHLDNDGFWGDRENDYIDDDILEGKSIEDYVNERYSYVDEARRPEIVAFCQKSYNDTQEAGE